MHCSDRVGTGERFTSELLEVMLRPAKHVMDRRKLERRGRNPQLLHDGSQTSANELLECFLRLKHVNDSPTAFHRACNVIHPSRRGDVFGLQCLDNLVVLILRQTWNLVQNCKCHNWY